VGVNCCPKDSQIKVAKRTQTAAKNVRSVAPYCELAGRGYAKESPPYSIKRVKLGERQKSSWPWVIRGGEAKKRSRRGACATTEVSGKQERKGGGKPERSQP